MNNCKTNAMKRGIIILLAIIFCLGSRVSAQNQRLDNLNAYKIGFFTRRLNLTSQEAEKFWPVYNEFQKQKTQIQIEKASIIKNFNQNETTLSDSQLTEIGDKLVASIVDDSELAVTFHKKLKAVLPPAKVIRFYQAENQYKSLLLKELQENRSQQRTRELPEL